jgi:hypothetical protein
LDDVFAFAMGSRNAFVCLRAVLLQCCEYAQVQVQVPALAALRFI